MVFETETPPPEGTMVQVVSASDAPTVSDAELDPFFRMDELSVETGTSDLMIDQTRA